MMDYKTLCAAPLLLLFTCAAAPADEVEHTYRVLGLFQRDREGDLRKVVNQLPEIELVKADYETGQATFRFDAETTFPGRGPDQLPEALGMLLRTNSRGTFEAAPRTDKDRSKLSKIEIDVRGLDCKGCSYAAYLAVYKLDGVENAVASFRKGRVVAWVDAKKTERKALVAALVEKGVDVVDADE